MLYERLRWRLSVTTAGRNSYLALNIFSERTVKHLGSAFMLEEVTPINPIISKRGFISRTAVCWATGRLS